MNKIPGKLRAEDLPQLAELVEDKNVLQLGCYCGRGLVALSRHAKKVWVLEDFRYPDGVEGIVAELKCNVDRYAPEDSIINLLRGDAESWAVPEGSEQLGAVDVVYRDANRGRLSEELDQRLALGLLKRYGGVYAWHNEDRELKWLQVQPVPVEAN